MGNLLGALGGLIAAAVGLAAAEVIAGLSAGLRSPVLDVGDRFILWVPSWLKDLAIEWFGTNDKIALLVGIGVVIGAYAAGIGVVGLTRRRTRTAVTGVALFALVGAAAAVFGRSGAGVLAAAHARWFDCRGGSAPAADLCPPRPSQRVPGGPA